MHLETQKELSAYGKMYVEHRHLNPREQSAKQSALGTQISFVPVLQYQLQKTTPISNN